MENLENNEFAPEENFTSTPLTAPKTNRKTTTPELTWLEASIQSRRNDLNFPALQSFFGLTETELQTILDKLPPADCSTC